MKELNPNLAEQFSNLPPDQQAALLAKANAEMASGEVGNPAVKTEFPKGPEESVPGVKRLTKEEMLGASGNIPVDSSKPQNSVSIGESTVVVNSKPEGVKEIVLDQYGNNSDLISEPGAADRLVRMLNDISPDSKE